MTYVLLGSAAIIAIGLGIAESNAQQPQIDGSSQQAPPPRELSRNLAPTPPKGSSAIAPHFAAVPVFTLADAKEYVATHPLPLGAARDYKPQVTHAEFLTSQQVSERLHGVITGFLANHVLCYMELLGPFSFTGPQGALATYSRGVLIFDAETGNLVISGGMP
jgi:hypothetical protein